MNNINCKLIIAVLDHDDLAIKDLLRKEINWEVFFHLIIDNNLSLRFYEAIIKGNYSIDLPSYFIDSVNTRYEKNKIFIEWILKLSKEFQRKNVDAIFIKTFDAYPDMGTDIDILAVADFKKAIKVISKMDLVPHKLSLPEQLLGKFTAIPNDNSLIGIDLYPKLSRIGEDFIYENNIINKRKEKFKINNGEIIFISSKEDILLIHCIHSLYFNGFVSLGMLLSLIKNFDSNFDWDYVIKNSKKSNLTLGIYYILRIINESVCNDLIPDDIIKNFHSKSFIKFSTKKFNKDNTFPYIISEFHLMILYISKIILDLKDFKIMNSIKLSIAFVVATRNRYYKVFMKYRGINQNKGF